MKATSADAFNDVIVTSATIISLIVGKLIRLNIDGWMGLIVSLFVVFSGFRIAKDTIMPLLGEPVDRDVYTLITKMVEKYEGIMGSHDLIAHNYGPSHIMASIHVEVANNSNIEEVHEIIDKIEKDILSETGIFLVIHTDPVEVNDSSFLEKKLLLIKIVHNIEPKATVQDIRFVSEQNKTNAVFDLVVPPFYTEMMEQSLMSKISESIRILDKNCNCVISTERSYIAEP
jgi:hypothetical protein